MRISDWSSDVFSSDLLAEAVGMDVDSWVDAWLSATLFTTASTVSTWSLLSDNSAAISTPFSPGANNAAIGVPTSTSLLAWTSILPSTPDCSALNSITAFSVSFSSRQPPYTTFYPSCLLHAPL